MLKVLITASGFSWITEIRFDDGPRARQHGCQLYVTAGDEIAVQMALRPAQLIDQVDPYTVHAHKGFAGFNHAQPIEQAVARNGADLD